MERLFQSSIAASLAKRLGEAADGFRNVGEVYFVAGHEWPHKIKEFFDLQTAKDFLSGLDPNEFELFGPFDTTDELKSSNHNGSREIQSIDLIIKYKDGHQHKETLNGNIDSIFLNLSSFDKFVFPYYCHVYGASYAKTLRDKLIASYIKFAKEYPADDPKKPPPAHPHLLGTLLTGLNDEETWHE